MELTAVEQPLAELLLQPEGSQLAFVRGKFRPDELAETLAAFANAQGGTVVVGVGGRGRQAEGVADAQTAIDAALDAALLCTPPLVLPLPVATHHGASTLLLLRIPPGLPHVYSVHGKYLRREGASDRPIAPDALRRLLIERGETSWDRLVPEDTTLDELDPNKVAAYVRRAGPAAEGDPLAFLFRRGGLARTEGRGLRAESGSSDLNPQSSVLSPYVPTNAGLLLFGENTAVERRFPQCEITLVRYRGRDMSDEFIREDIRDTLVEAVRRAEIWLSEHMRRGSRMVGLER